MSGASLETLLAVHGPVLPVVIDEEWIEEIRKTLPELPDARKERFIGDYELPEYDAGILTASRDLADYFEAAVGSSGKAKKVSNWIMTELLRELKGEDVTVCKVKPEQLGGLLQMVDEGTISGKILSDFPQFRHVSTGDELRQHVRNQTEIGREAKTYMDGELI